MIEEELREANDAKEELKRADHLIFVSLKYTRTVDVLLSIIVRLMNALEITTDEILEYLVKKKKLKDINVSKPLRIKVGWIKEKFKKDKNVQELEEFYELLLRIVKAKTHIRRSEFRKNLALIAQDKNGEEIAEVTVDVVKEYYKQTEDLIGKLEKIMK